MKKLLALGVLLAAVFAVTLAVIPKQDLDAIPCCEGYYQSATTHWTMANDCATAESYFRAETIGEAQATCSPTYPCGVTLPACYYDSGSGMWIVDGKLTWGCKETCGPPPM